MDLRKSITALFLSALSLLNISLIDTGGFPKYFLRSMRNRGHTIKMCLTVIALLHGIHMGTSSPVYRKLWVRRVWPRRNLVNFISSIRKKKVLKLFFPMTVPISFNLLCCIEIHFLFQKVGGPGGILTPPHRHPHTVEGIY